MSVRAPEPGRTAYAVPAPRPDWPRDAVEAVERLVATVDGLRVETAQLEHALQSRIAVEQAKGVLAERLGVPVDLAFSILRRAARSEQMRLHELARVVVGSQATPPPVAREIARLARLGRLQWQS